MRPAPSAKPLGWDQYQSKDSAKTVHINPKKTIKNLSIKAQSPNGKPFEMDIAGYIAESGKITAKIKTISNSKKDFTLTAHNAGAFLSAYDSFHHYKNGTLTASGSIVKNAGVPA